MKTKTFLALLLLVIAGCGCSKTGEIKQKISPTIDKEVETFLSTKISNKGEKSNYFNRIDKDSILIINSEKQLKEVFNDTTIPIVNFNKYSLLIGQKKMPNLYYTVKNQFIEKEGTNSTLFLEVSLPKEGHYPAFSWLYYWGIYPKIDNNTRISLKINNEN